MLIRVIGAGDRILAAVHSSGPIDRARLQPWQVLLSFEWLIGVVG